MITLFLGDVGTEIVLDCGMDVSAATVRQIVARKASGTLVEWDALPEGSNSIKYVTQPDDLNVVGEWQLQAKIEMPGWSGLGNIVPLKVARPV